MNMDGLFKDSRILVTESRLGSVNNSTRLLQCNLCGALIAEFESPKELHAKFHNELLKDSANIMRLIVNL